jgi:hypothetical protein
VINLITDPAVWLQNMKILINHFTIESYQFHEYESNRAFCAILSPSQYVKQTLHELSALTFFLKKSVPQNAAGCGVETKNW